jgi:tRNA (guanine37-N1)-methyltransferase
MNLPDSAISFLDAFREAIPRELMDLYEQMPFVHCYCFSRESELDAAGQDIKEVCLMILWLSFSEMLF